MSDEVAPLVDSPEVGKTFSAVDLIVACGDLPSAYLEYALTAMHKPLVYVPGNHDQDDFMVPGGEDIDGRLRQILDVSMLGFGGSVRYKRAGRHQYTQSEMMSRMIPFLPRLGLRRLIAGVGLDLLVTHSPPFGIHDQDDPAHQGFKIFRQMISLIRPRYMVHGHTHVLSNIQPNETIYAGCRIINVFPYRSFSIDL